MRDRKSLSAGLTAVALIVLSCVIVFRVPSTSAQSDEVWALEDAYWRYVQAGDVDSYLDLWHEDFVGWQCRATNPSRKDGIADWVRVIRDESLELTYDIDRKALQYFGDVAVVHYTTPTTRRYPDGRVLYEGQLWKFTHTWMRAGNSWQIIGGMCGEVSTE